MYQELAIIGISGRFPEANNLDEFWLNMVNGRDSIRELPESRLEELRRMNPDVATRFVKNGYIDKMAEFEPGYFNISSEEAKYIDPQHRMTLELVEEAIQNAGYTADALRKQNVGVFMAHSINSYSSLLNDHPFNVVNALESAMAGRVAYTFDFDGPVMTVDTACSSSLVALHNACTYLKSGQCGVAIVGGFQVFARPASWLGMQDYPVFAKSEKLSAFAAGADGTLGGEGGGILVVKPLDKAVDDGDIIHAVIKGSAINSDAGNSNGLSAPSKVAQSRLIKKALADARLLPEDIDFIEAHGTGTELGDPIEAEAIAEVFSHNANKMLIGTVKTNIGHLVGMAGFAGVVKSVLSLKHKKLPPSLNFDQPNPHIDFDNLNIEVNDKLSDIPARGRPSRIGVSSFGVIGTNAHVIIEEAPSKPLAEKGKDTWHLIPVSARSADSLLKQVRSLDAWLERNPGVLIKDLAYTLATGRRHLQCRVAFLVQNTTELRSQLYTYLHSPSKVTPIGGKRIFLFPAQTSSWDPATFQELDEQLSPEPLHQPFTSKHSSLVAQHRLSQFASTVGVIPEGVIGWGEGKRVANVMSGKAIFDDLLRPSSPETNDLPQIKDKLRNLVSKGFKEWICFDYERSVFDADFVNELTEEGVNVRFIYNVKTLLELLATYYQQGNALDWNAIFSISDAVRIQVVPYQFAKEIYLPSGKSLRSSALTRAQVAEASEDTSSAVVKCNAQSLLKIMMGSLPEGADPQLSFEENGGDSLDMLQVQDQIQSDFKLKIPLDTLFDTISLHDLAEKLEKQLAGSGAVSENIIPSNDSELEQKLKDMCGGFLTAELDVALSFSDNGGTSLDVLDIIDKLSDDFGITVSYEEFYSYDTLQNLLIGLVRKISDGKEVRKPTSVHKGKNFSIDLQNQFDKNHASDRILVTGATGFLGAHLVKELIASQSSTVYCLVRAKDVGDAENRIRNVLSLYFDGAYEHLVGKQIIALPGDISSDNFGLEQESYQCLSENIGKVIHTAAEVRQVLNKEALFGVNVAGTQRIIDFCLNGMNKELHHCSTYTVSGRSDTVTNFSENDLEIKQSFGRSAYAESKYQSEVLIHQHRSKGLKASIYRIGNLTGRFADGKFQSNMTDNLLYSSWKAISVLGAYTSAQKNDQIELSPVDLCASAFVRIMQRKSALGKTYHLMNPSQTSYVSIFDSMKRAGHHLKELPKLEFNELVNASISAGDKDGLFRKLRLLYGPADSGKQDAVNRLTYTFEQTEEVLRAEGFCWPEIDHGYLEKLMDSLADWDKLTTE